MSEMDRRRDEALQAIAAGVGTFAQVLIAVSDAIRKAAEAVEAIAEKLEDEATTEPTPTPTGPTGVVPTPTGPTGVPTPPTEPTGSEPPIEPPTEPTGPTGMTGPTGVIDPDPTGPTGPPVNP